jgi:hypothetical protein
MAQSYQDYIKSLTPAGSTKVPTYTPVPQTGKQIVQDALKGVTPGGSTKVPTYTPVPQTGKQIVQDAVKNVAPQATQAPIQSQPNYGVSDYTAGVSSQGGSTYVPPPPLSTQQSVGLSKDYGLKGLKDNAYTGLTMGQAQQKAAADKKMYQDSTSAGTSYTYNPQSISGFNDKSKQMNAKLDTVKNDAFTSTQQKKSDADAIIKSYTNEFAGLFSTPQEFQSALTSSPEIQKAVQDYQRAGGQLSDIASSIGVKTQQNTQTLDQYLGRISTPAEQKAYDSLIPEQKAYQDQIAFEQSVPQQYKDLYFGTPERVGILERERIVAQEKAKNLEEQALRKDITDRAKAELTIQKNQADMEEELATVEQNRLSARNYSTRMLAKMGALNTTGAAVEKLTSLEQRYQLQSQRLRTAYNFKAREIESNLNQTLNDTEAKKQDAIIKIKEDLSRSEVEIAKEIMKLDVTSSREIYKITDKYLSEYRTQKDKYVKEAKAEAEKNAKAAATIASSYNLSGLTFDNFLKSKSTGGESTKVAGNSAIGGMDIITGGQSFDPNQTQKQYPAYLQALIQSGAVSPETQAVLKGEKSIVDLTEKESTIAKKEIKQLGINANTISTKAVKPDIESALSGARDAIATIDDSNLSTKEKDAKKAQVKQAFIGKFPTSSATYKAYFEE